MKKLIEFTINKIVREKKEEIVKNESGEEVKREIETSKRVPYVFTLKKPTRGMFDEAELYYGVKLGEGIKAGMITRSMLAKRFNNDGGVFSDPEIKDINDIYKNLFDAENDFQRLSAKQDKTEEEKKELEECKNKYIGLRREIQRSEMGRESLYDKTADTRAKNKLLIWWLIALSYQKENGKDVPFFKGENLDEQLDDYEEISEGSDEVKKLALKKFLYFVSFWNSTGASIKEEFDKAVQGLEDTNKVSGEFDDIIETIKQEEV